MSSFSISTLFIKDLDSNAFLEHYYDDLVDKSAINSISRFLDGASNFSRNELREYLSRVEFDRVWIEFLWIGKYSIILISNVIGHINDKLVSQYNKITHAINSMSLRLIDGAGQFSDNKMEFLRDQLDTIIMMMNADIDNYTNAMLNTPAKEVYKDLVIDISFLCDISSIPVVYREYTNAINADPYLMTSILSALSSFGGRILDQKLRCLYFTNKKVMLLQKTDMLFVIVFSCCTSKSITQKIRNKMESMLDSIADTIDGEIGQIEMFDVNHIVVKEFELIIDKHINLLLKS